MIKLYHKMYILGIETTCDETGIALIEAKDKKIKIIKNELALQYQIHRPYGGVVPILAAREHQRNLPFLLKKIENGFDLTKIDYLAFSVGPGLLPALVAGKEFTQNLAKKLNKKIIPVNHLDAHFYSVVIKNKLGGWQRIKEVEFPALVLIVSGGHTNLYLFKNWVEKKLLGSTLDDAAGESFDKCARALNLPYPGGPEIERLSRKAKNYFSLPKPMLQRGYFFSFSGLKTAFIDLFSEIKKLKKVDEQVKADLAASLQKTIIEILIYKLKKARENFRVKSIAIGGGVAANKKFKRTVIKFFPYENIYFPESTLATDNGLNIALGGYFFLNSKKEPLPFDKVDVFPRELLS